MLSKGGSAKAELLCVPGPFNFRLPHWTIGNKGEQDGWMSDFRSFAPDLHLEEDTLTLSPFESHHLVATNRARQGDEVTLFNGNGLEWTARLEEADRRESTLTKISRIEHDDPDLKITLAISIIKGKSFDVILRQATELGVHRIQPLQTSWSQVHIKDVDSKMDRWRMHLIEACKQSGNPWLPNLAAPKTLDSFLSEQAFETSVVASLETDAGNWRDLNLAADSTLFVGPEGDFTPKEYRLLKDSGAQPVSLGVNVLRSETAVVSAISILHEQIKQPAG